MENAFTALAATGLIVLFSFAFILVGLAFLKKILMTDVLSLGLLVPMSFFIGMAVFFTSWTGSESLMGRADVGLYLSLGVMIVFGIKEKSHQDLLKWLQGFKHHRLSVVILLTVLPTLFILARVIPSNFDIDVPLGSGSTILYFNKAMYFYMSNSIPSLSVSIGQSLLASMSLFFGLKSTGIFNLCMWTYVTMFFFSFLVYQFLTWMNFSKYHAKLGTFFVFFGNASLSFLPICVVDSGVPFILGMYPLTFFTVGSFSSVLILFHLWRVHSLKSGPFLYIIAFFLLFSWTFTSPESMALGIPALFLYGISKLRKGELVFSKILPWGILFALTIVLGVTQGGLLSPAAFRDVEIEQSIPGWQFSPIGQKFKINPGLDFSATLAPAMFAVQFPSGQRFHAGNRGKEAVIPYEFDGAFSNALAELLNKQNLKVSTGVLLVIETETWLALRILFFPIFGVLFIFLYLRNKSSSTILEKDFSTATAVLFLGAFILIFFPYQSGMKWPFTRFLLPSYALAQISCFMGFLYFFEKFSWKEKVRSRSLFLLIAILSFGQVLGLATNVIANTGALNQNGEDVWVRASRMVTVDSIVPALSK